MCRWFAYISETEPASYDWKLLEDILIRPQHSIVKQVQEHYLPGLFHHVDKASDEEQRADIAARNLFYNDDGTGVAFYTTVGSEFGCVSYPTPQVYKTTMPPTNDINFRSLCENACSTTVFAHVRMATSEVQQFNNHPFTFGRHIFMHNGGVAHFTQIRRGLCEKMSQKAFGNIHGSTDSEHLAALYMSYLGDAWDTVYSLEEMKLALEKAIGDVLDLQSKLPGATTPIAASSLNLCTTDGSKLLAFRYRNSDGKEQPPSLYFTTTAGVTLNRKYPGHPDFEKDCDIPREHVAGFCGDDVLAAENHGDHVIVASEPTTCREHEWKLIPKNQAVMVHFVDGQVNLRLEDIKIPK
ncbi:N-terminal nucleophile aminohydrolase [Marasmius fiardii PR-910]|nr:N-terminal nucleophile aminohydrolase [Marasmius fiardii PR-910]